MQADPSRVFICPECGSIATVMWAKRPICVHAWEGNAGTPEIWDGDNTNGEGRKVEESPHEPYRVPGPDTWAQMVPWKSVNSRELVSQLSSREIRDLAERDRQRSQRAGSGSGYDG